MGECVMLARLALVIRLVHSANSNHEICLQVVAAPKQKSDSLPIYLDQFKARDTCSKTFLLLLVRAGTGAEGLAHVAYLRPHGMHHQHLSDNFLDLQAPVERYTLQNCILESACHIYDNDVFCGIDRREASRTFLSKGIHQIGTRTPGFEKFHKPK